MPGQIDGNRMRIGAGVLHYRSWPGVRTTIDALLAQSRQPDEMLVVDHASDDGSAQSIREAYPQLEVVELSGNRGPTAGMNRMMTAVLERGVDAVFVLSDDFELAPDAFEQLAARLEADPSLGAVGPVVAHQRSRDRIFYAGGYVDPRNWDLQFLDTPAQLSEWKGRPPHRVDFLELGGILIRASATRDTGLLPEHFYYLNDDVDFTIRLGAHGWGLECVPAAVAWQDLGDQSRQTLLAENPPYLEVRNRLGLLARNAPRRIVVREVVRVLSWLVRDAIRPRTGSRADLRPRLQGLVDFCRGRWGPPDRWR